jgi:hypothetical protein
MKYDTLYRYTRCQPPEFRQQGYLGCLDPEVLTGGIPSLMIVMHVPPMHGDRF